MAITITQDCMVECSDAVAQLGSIKWHKVIRRSANEHFSARSIDAMYISTVICTTDTSAVDNIATIAAHHAQNVLSIKY